MVVGLVWAQSRNGVIGADGRLPWQLPEDMRAFRELTAGTTVVMGRRTWESLPERFRPLPGRRNVVLSRRSDWRPDGAELVASPDQAPLDGEVWVIGGAEVYAALLPLATRAVVTDVDIEVTGDVPAPVLDGGWRATDRSPADGWHTSVTGLRYAVTRYERAAAIA